MGMHSCILFLQTTILFQLARQFEIVCEDQLPHLYSCADYCRKAIDLFNDQSIDSVQRDTKVSIIWRRFVRVWVHACIHTSLCVCVLDRKYHILTSAVRLASPDGPYQIRLSDFNRIRIEALEQSVAQKRSPLIVNNTVSALWYFRYPDWFLSDSLNSHSCNLEIVTFSID